MNCISFCQALCLSPIIQGLKALGQYVLSQARKMNMHVHSQANASLVYITTVYNRSYSPWKTSVTHPASVTQCDAPSCLGLPCRPLHVLVGDMSTLSKELCTSHKIYGIGSYFFVCLVQKTMFKSDIWVIQGLTSMLLKDLSYWWRLNQDQGRIIHTWLYLKLSSKSVKWYISC